MKLLKLGTAYLNMELVTDAWVNRGTVTVFFAVPAMYSAAPFHGVTNAVSTREVTFHGAQATALIKWLKKQAKDITPEGDEPENTGVQWEAEEIALTDEPRVDDGPS